MKRTQSKGFSLLEVLIAFVILVVGLLGATILVIRSSQISMTAYETEQVALLANTFVEKIRTNPVAIDSYLNKKNDKRLVADCINKNNSCTASERALTDMKRFEEQIKQLTLTNPDWSLVELTSSNTLKGDENKAYQLRVDWGENKGANLDNTYYLNFVIRIPSTTP